MTDHDSTELIAPPIDLIQEPSEEEWNKFVYSLWDKYDFAGEPFTWSDFCKALNDARSSLTLWGNHSADASKMVSPAPVPTEGEVAELVAWLGDEADQYDCIQQAPETARRLRRTADLFAQRHPAPVPVSERLPGPGDCDDDGTCWVWNRTAYTWGLFRFDLTAHSHWLPSAALPLPAAEVQQ